MRYVRCFFCVTVAVAVSACGPSPERSRRDTARPPPSAVAAGDWPLINRDLSANRYSPLTEITAANVASLQPKFTYALGGNSTAVPVVVSGVMYLPSRDRVVAIDGDTGAEIWTYVLPAPPAPPGGAPGGAPGGGPTARRSRRAASATGPATARSRHASCS